MKRLTSLFLCLLIAVSLCSCDTFYKNSITNADGGLIVHYIDVGQGDCILLESEDDYVLIDAGEAEYSPTVCQYLDNNNVQSIDYVIATHPHSDHCGGLTDVINRFDCDNFITVETNQQTKTWMNVLNAVDNRDVNYIDAKVGNTYSFGKASFEILGPYGTNYEGYNDYSVVLRATYQDTSFLFTGDAEKVAEHEMLDNGADLKADVLKVAHHGSSSSSSKEFLDSVSPTYAVIMCGLYNDYGHPHKEIQNSLKNRRILCYRTDTMGTIVAVSDGKNIEFFYENEDTVPIETTIDASQTALVGNKNSKKFHYAWCSGLADMNQKNKVSFKTRDEAVQKGYSPCKTCNP